MLRKNQGLNNSVEIAAKYNYNHALKIILLNKLFQEELIFHGKLRISGQY